MYVQYQISSTGKCDDNFYNHTILEESKKRTHSVFIVYESIGWLIQNERNYFNYQHVP